jgi:hypothetical protein
MLVIGPVRSESVCDADSYELYASTEFTGFEIKCLHP